MSKTIKYGFLYNWPAVTNASPICASNAHVPTNAEWTALTDYLGGLTVAGGKLKEIGLSHWSAPNTGATNEFGFTALPGGERSNVGVFSNLNNYGEFWTSTLLSGYTEYSHYKLISYEHDDVVSATHYNEQGFSIRLIIDSPIEINGNTAIYVGNDGHRYNCVLINSVWWLAENLIETNYRDGSLIPEITDNTAWTGLTIGGRCAYDNDKSNAFTYNSSLPSLQTTTPPPYLFKLISNTETVVCDTEPIEWESGSIEMKRDLELGGVFITFLSDSLTFVGNGAALLRSLYEAFEINAKCTLIIYYWKNWGSTPETSRIYVEFPSQFNINFSFYEIVAVSKFHFGVKIKAVNSSMQTKLDSRQDINVDVTKLVSIGGITITDYLNLKKDLYYSATNVSYSAALSASGSYGIGIILGTASYTSVPLAIVTGVGSDFTEIQAVGYKTKQVPLAIIPSFFRNAKYDYEFEITYTVSLRNTGGIHLESCIVEILETKDTYTFHTEIVNTYDIGTIGVVPWQPYTWSDTVTVNVSKGNDLKLVVKQIGVPGNVMLILQDIKITQIVSQSLATNTEGFPVYEAVERTCQLILDTQYPFYSEYFGREDVAYKDGVNYSAENQLRFAHIQSGLNQRGIRINDVNTPLSLNFKDLFQTIKAIWNVGYCLEMIEGFLRVRIEEYAFFFQDTLVRDFSARINKYDISSQVMPELVPVDIKSGFDSFEYLSLNGRAEPNTTNQRTSIMNTDKKFEVISKYRGDTKGTMDNISNPVLAGDGSTDTKGEGDIFIIKSQKGGDSGYDWIPEKATNIEIVGDSSLFKDDLLNRYFTPTRMLIRHGNRIKSGMTKYPDSVLRFQKTDKDCSLITTGEGLTALAENADIVVSSLANPIYKAIKHTAIIPSWTFADLKAIQDNPLCYVSFGIGLSGFEIKGYLLSLKKKNDEDKAEISIIEKYTS